MKLSSCLLCILLIVLGSCGIGAGTLGVIGSWRVTGDRKVLQNELNTFTLRHPEYLPSDKWKSMDDWTARGYDFLEGKVIYFREEPEEMYFVTIKDPGVSPDMNSSTISIRAICDGQGRWQKKEDLSDSEVTRVSDRFEKEVLPILTIRKYVRD